MPKLSKNGIVTEFPESHVPLFLKLGYVLVEPEKQPEKQEDKPNESADQADKKKKVIND